MCFYFYFYKVFLNPLVTPESTCGAPRASCLGNRSIRNTVKKLEKQKKKDDFGYSKKSQTEFLTCFSLSLQ